MRIKVIALSIVLSALLLAPAITAQLGPVDPPSAVFIGQVLDEDATPVADAEVTIENRDTGNSTITVTNETGWFSVTDLPSTAGDRIDFEASHDEKTGEHTLTIDADADPIYEMEITIKSKSNSMIWLMLIAGIVILAIVVISFFIPEKGDKPENKNGRKQE